MPSFRFFAVVGLAAVMIPATASAQAWRQVYRDSQVNVAIDTSRIARVAANTYTVLMRWNYTSPRLNEQRRQYTRLIQQVQVRCRPTPVRVKRYSMALYNATGGLVEEARPLSASQISMMDWERLPARSEGSRVYPAVCRTIAARSGA